LRHDESTHILDSMQFSDFINAGSGLGDMVQIVFFRMLPRGAQIEKVRAELNKTLLKNYGKLTRLEIDKTDKIIRLEMDLKGEQEGIGITLSNYRLLQEDGKNPVFETGAIEVSRDWLNALLQNLIKTRVIPECLEIKNLLHQAVVKSLL